MSTTSLNFHNVTSASAEILRAENCQWLSLDFRDRDGARLSLAIFSESPEELLQAIARAAAPEHDELVARLEECAVHIAAINGDSDPYAVAARAALTKAAPEQQERGNV